MSNLSQRFFSFLGGIILPEKTKRLVFLTSLMGRLVENHDPTYETLHKLNKLLDLCKIEDAMKLPISFSNAIWNNKTYTDLVVDSLPVKVSVYSILDKSPKWLKYGNTEAMVQDIETILSNYKALELT